jgi:hypothetical protein
MARGPSTLRDLRRAIARICGAPRRARRPWRRRGARHEAALVRAAQRGSERAVEELFARHRRSGRRSRACRAAGGCSSTAPAPPGWSRPTAPGGGLEPPRAPRGRRTAASTAGSAGRADPRWPGGRTTTTRWPTSTPAAGRAWWRSTRVASLGMKPRGDGPVELAWSPDVEGTAPHERGRSLPHPRRATSGSAGHHRRSSTKGAVSGPAVDAPVATQLDDEQERTSRLLLVDETDSLRRSVRPAARCSIGRKGATRLESARLSREGSQVITRLDGAMAPLLAGDCESGGHERETRHGRSARPCSAYARAGPGEAWPR